MKCPVCNVDLVSTKRHRVEMEMCPTCHGLWLTPKELEQLEDQVFDFGDNEKGSLMLSETDTALKCPECGAAMKRFQYRLYDTEMDFCEAGHGYWLDADEDARVLELMKKEEHDLGRTVLAQDRWTSHLRYVQSGRFADRIRDLIHVAMDPRVKR